MWMCGCVDVDADADVDVDVCDDVVNLLQVVRSF
jgi:hypothetical protein